MSKIQPAFANDEIIVINNLQKNFRKNKALKGVSFSVKRGELFGYLGLNGAGKTVTLNIILGLLKRDGGEVYINGLNIDKNQLEIRNQVGIVFQESILDPELSVRENLMIRATLYKDFLKDETVASVVDKIIDEFQLNDFASRRYGTLSGGQKRRADIARALVHSPNILFLDEPTTGLDPNSRKLVWQILKKIQQTRKLTIMLTTHYMEEADDCSRVIILEKGKKLVQDTPAALKTKYSSSKIRIYQMSDELKELINTSADLNYQIDNQTYILQFPTVAAGQSFVANNIQHLKDFEFNKGTMDEVFLNVTQKGKGQNE
ncbi:spermidine/putrescine ABC transporter ATP-binding protein [Mycoplasmopsis californica HAZ160_1]|uniref:ABC transporter ATP-binding protein n=2 Tax=Mycoplasmopsis californica TaxID=2113 RepID=A0A059XLL8_9BACT|nr:ABC transporter ATP-binding protein [Mycoplasmopsis californica]AIA29429.1 ABC transporter ATP-binding protein [Mycoplasmopsis californica]BAP01122.1 spermidine/putrescine ABC transporter ATP-binding protein [Mycoplasmopsis californica HAZ160_1]BBG40988.1 spermidine/putrescine ABC transporter ATP-binding protein [Mycoplasmopsis californica]BBG41581.1 spermidine/putrescine ABC transporter ATP-binding protein [Mycoplasmopsis californica]BBG42175.1 spermidine/putrescine ABC transporter ATP-bin